MASFNCQSDTAQNHREEAPVRCCLYQIGSWACLRNCPDCFTDMRRPTLNVGSPDKRSWATNELFASLRASLRSSCVIAAPVSLPDIRCSLLGIRVSLQKQLRLSVPGWDSPGRHAGSWTQQLPVFSLSAHLMTLAIPCTNLRNALSILYSISSVPPENPD